MASDIQSQLDKLSRRICCVAENVGEGGGGSGVQSVSGLNTNNTDPANPIIRVSVDGTTITGAGTPGNPLISNTGATPNLQEVTDVAPTTPITNSILSSAGFLVIGTGDIGLAQSDLSGNGIAIGSNTGIPSLSFAVGGVVKQTLDASLAGSAAQIYKLPGSSGTLITSVNLTTAGTNGNVVLPIGSKIVTVSNVQISNTGSTTENTVYTGSIPANSIGANGTLHITALWSWTNNANTKTFKVKFNGTTVVQHSQTTSATVLTYTKISNRNATNAQVSGNTTSAAASIGIGVASSAAVATYTFDTTSLITVTITIQNAVGTDTASIESFEIEAR